jgi:tetratricopeptide (TPR) repeat protein
LEGHFGVAAVEGDAEARAALMRKQRLCEERRHDRAIADFNEAIRLDPNTAPAYRNRGDAYRNKGDKDRAIHDYNQAIGLDPNDAFAFCNRGRVKRNINDMSGDADIANARQLNASVCR